MERLWERGVRGEVWRHLPKEVMTATWQGQSWAESIRGREGRLRSRSVGKPRQGGGESSRPHCQEDLQARGKTLNLAPHTSMHMRRRSGPSLSGCRHGTGATMWAARHG